MAPRIERRIQGSFFGDYRTVKAVDGISFDINAGEIVGYIGPNGAGKSTTIKMMTGILKPTDGTILINGLMRRTQIASSRHRSWAWSSVNARNCGGTCR